LQPERFSGGSYDIRSDVWALGITLLELATFKHPYITMAEASIVDVFQLITTGMCEHWRHCSHGWQHPHPRCRPSLDTAPSSPTSSLHGQCSWSRYLLTRISLNKEPAKRPRFHTRDGILGLTVRSCLVVLEISITPVQEYPFTKSNVDVPCSAVVSWLQAELPSLLLDV
jgi:serine/threonine protein kinase